jgi:hypothetical protein
MSHSVFVGEETQPGFFTLLGDYSTSSRTTSIFQHIFISDVTAPSNVNVLLPAQTDPFEQQKAAFLQIPPLIRAEYSGKWVISKDGKIVDSDSDLQRLSKRFFDAHGDVDVYIAKVNQRAPYRIRTPFLRK